METDIYETWNLIEELPNNLYFHGLNDEAGGLTVLLKELGSNDRVLRIKFTGVLGYRVVQEAGRLKTLHENPSLVGFETSTNSEFLRWFDEESRGMFDDSGLIHYAICSSDNIIDVISGPPVSVEWVPPYN